MKNKLLLFLLLLLSSAVFGQDCPPNIGFESGDFTGWKCYAGTIKDGILDMPESNPIANRHTLLINTSPQQLDPYGKFPVNSPNGSKYTLKLGNSQTGAEIESVSYDFIVPTDRYTLTYYYAVVLQNPDRHDLQQQARFSARLEDVTGSAPTQLNRSSLDCGNHDFVASSGLAGFITDGVIQYKPWSPVSLKLVGYKGRKIRLSFTTNDCTKGGHFGYAYLDFEEDCGASLIKGNNYCEGTNEVILTAPSGFQNYAWYDEGFTTNLGSSSTLILNPIPANDTKYALIVSPPAGLGCTDTLYTNISSIAQPFNLNIAEPVINRCKSDGADLTDPAITVNSSADMEYKYYLDAQGQSYVSDPKRVTIPGTYYIRGTNKIYGCTDIKPVNVTLSDGPPLNVSPAQPVCAPNTVNITTLVHNTSGATIKYYTDQLATQLLPNPTAVSVSGTYYVKATSDLQCSTIIPIAVVVNQLPVATPKSFPGCPPISLNQIVGDGDVLATSYQFFYDANGTHQVQNPDNLTLVSQSGRYYYRGLNGTCAGNISTIDVTVYKVPQFEVTDPAPVTFPATINLADVHPNLSDATYTYWYDATASQKPITDFRAIGKSGTYYIKAQGTTGGCELIKAVHVIINAPPEAGLNAANTFTPNGDGVNDLFNPTTTGVLNINYLKIFNRYGKQVYETKQSLTAWDGKLNGQPLPVGTYYWVFSCYDIYRKATITRSGPITIIR